MNVHKSLAVEIMGTMSMARNWFSSGIPKLTLLILLLFVNFMQCKTMGVGLNYATFVESTQEEHTSPSCSIQAASSQNLYFQGYRTLAVPTNEMSTTGLPGAQSLTASLPMVSGGRQKRKPLSTLQSPPQVTPKDPVMEELALAYDKRAVAKHRRYRSLQEANRRREIRITRQKQAQRWASALPSMAVHQPALPHVQALWSDKAFFNTVSPHPSAQPLGHSPGNMFWSYQQLRPAQAAGIFSVLTRPEAKQPTYSPGSTVSSYTAAQPPGQSPGSVSWAYPAAHNLPENGNLTCSAAKQAKFSHGSTASLHSTALPPAEAPSAHASPCQALLEQNTQTRRRALPRNEDDHDAAVTLLGMHERREETESKKGGRK